MYENLTYEDILKRLMERVPASLDRREGSVIYDALAPCAMELKLMYLALDEVIEDTFADTASREFLIRRAAERGIAPKPASAAEIRAVCVPKEVQISAGTRFSADGVYYCAAECTESGCRLVCESTGSVGNRLSGELIPVDYVRGLEKISAVELLIPGEDEEETEAFRSRYLTSFEMHAFGGNVDDYVQKVGAAPGVGAVRVVPVWKGGGTVLIQILDSEYNVPSAELIERVQNFIDPDPAMGAGLAPIGHSVTVGAPSEFPVDVSFGLVFGEGFSYDMLADKIGAAVGGYLLEIRKGWAERGGSVVRISQLESRLMNIVGIVDIFGTALCGRTENLELSADEIPVAGVIAVGE